MASRTLSIGGATYDLFVRTQESLTTDRKETSLVLRLGAKMRVRDVIETCGGGASNTSVGLARLGYNASFCGVLGSDQWGERLLENLKRENVSIDGATVVDGETSSFSLILSVETGERVILYTPGTNTHLDTVMLNPVQVESSDWIYLNHLHDEHCSIIDALCQILCRLSSDKRPGLSWNPGGSQIQAGLEDTANRALLQHARLLFLNKEEALAFSSKASVREAVEAILETGVEILCVTDGRNGSIGISRSESLFCPIDETMPVVDTTGAGDGFGVGATWAAIQGLTLRDILRAGTINAGNVVTKIGAQAGLLTDTDMRHRLTHVPLETSPAQL